jgi:hypothetical protein
LPTSQNAAVRKYRERLKRDGWVRCEVKVPREDVDVVRAVAAALCDPERGAAAPTLLRDRFGGAPRRSFKELLASCPLEGVELNRSLALPRDIDL